mmetsp:Transcript_53929/g.89832  ORF Transcript_53929/g.89832 Transcript_53929/m.89832 type:complete len:94 (+) Transcript_53929:967-1248(+)
MPYIVCPRSPSSVGLMPLHDSLCCRHLHKPTQTPKRITTHAKRTPKTKTDANGRPRQTKGPHTDEQFMCGVHATQLQGHLEATRQECELVSAR